MSRQRWSIAACLIVALFVTQLARGQVLKQVPENALVVIKTNNLKATSDKLGAMAQKFGLAQMNPQIGDPLGAFKQKANITAGLNEAGDAAIVVLPNEDKTKDEPFVVVLLPVSDYKAFTGNFAGATTEGDVTSIQFPNSPKPGFVSHWGDYAALTPNKEVLAKKPAGVAVSGLAAKELDAKDIVVFANMKSIREVAIPKLKTARDDAHQKMQQEMAAQPAGQKYSGLMGTAFDSVMDAVQQFLEQSNAATVGVSLSDSGINSTTLVEFDPASTWGQSISQVKNTDEPLITGLPESKYLVVGGLKVDSESFTKLADNITATFQPEIAKLGDEGKTIQTLIDSYKLMLKSTKSQSMGMIVPAGMLGQESIFQMAAVTRGDAKSILQAQHQAFDAQQAIMSAMAQDKNPVKTTYTANAKTVDGVQLNQFTTQPNMPANPSPEQMQMAQMMTMMYGPNGMVGYMGALGDDKAIGAVGLSDELTGKLITAAKADQPMADATVTKVAGELPKQRVAVAFVAIDQWINTLANYAKQFGMPINVQLPADLPPVGVSAGTEGSAVRIDSTVPTQLVQSLIAAGMQTYAQMHQMHQMQQGPPPGAPPGGAPQ